MRNSKAGLRLASWGRASGDDAKLRSNVSSLISKIIGGPVCSTSRPPPSSAVPANTCRLCLVDVYSEVACAYRVPRVLWLALALRTLLSRHPLPLLRGAVKMVRWAVIAGNRTNAADAEGARATKPGTTPPDITSRGPLTVFHPQESVCVLRLIPSNPSPLPARIPLAAQHDCSSNWLMRNASSGALCIVCILRAQPE